MPLNYHYLTLLKRFPKTGKSIMIVFVLIIITLFGVTYIRNFAWQDEVALWEDAVKKSPGKARVNVSMGTAYYNAMLYGKAKDYYMIALRIDPDSAEAHNGLGLACASAGSFDCAIEHYQSAIKLSPFYANAHFNFGLMYLNPEIRDLNKARKEFEAAMQINPHFQKAQQFLDYTKSLK